ncbi:hypothetical protein [Flavonifractor sp. An82]|uniref:RNA polymerase sigma factor n=1 Tax=Flavonifractor sp. An82 TaxID=1965660 RepID=UPI001FA8B99C|nr:hypothetical protein [Flavonifractor sp. An82]
MDQKIRSIEKLLFVPYQRHTAFNGQISIGVGLRFCAREFSPSGDKPPPAGAAYSIGLLNAHIQKAADFVFRYKVGRFHLRLPEQRVRGPPPPICFPQKNKSEVTEVHNYRKSDYAINKNSPNIVYRLHNEIIEITLEDYLKENPDKTEHDFAELKALSDQIYYEQDRAESAQTRKDVSIHGLEETEHCATRALDEEWEERVVDIQNRKYAWKALEQLFTVGALTEVQKRRFRLHVFQGLSTRQIGRMEGTSHQAVAKSINLAIAKLKKYFAAQG